MPSEISKRIDEAIKLGIAPLLKECGFKKKSRTFHKMSGAAIQAVIIQADKWNALSRQELDRGYDGRFTVNIGVYFHAVAEISEILLADDLPAVEACTVWRRLGDCMPEHGDKWWALGAGMDDRHVAYDVAGALKDFGIPWLDTTSTREGLRAAFSSATFSHYDARSPIALELLGGNQELASKLLHVQLDEGAWNLHFVEQMAEWARKHGLT